MQLDSVRELKTALTETLLAPLATSVHKRAALSIPVGHMAAAAAVPETIALGVAPRRKGDFALAVRIQQRALENSAQIDNIRRRARDEVDVRYIGRVVLGALPWHQRRNRPLRIGGSIGHFKITAGTLGCFVRSRGEDLPLILSNNHVLADLNRGKKGDTILQPGAIDQGQPSEDAVGILLGFVKLKRVGANLVDCAVAAVNDGIGHNRTNLTGLGKLAGVGDVVLDEGTAVAKVGRTTGTTHGRVTAFEVGNLMIGSALGNLGFDNQIEIEGAEDEPFSQLGDSGSLIVDEARRAVALLFAVGDHGGSNGKRLTYANPLRAVLDTLKVDVLY